MHVSDIDIASGFIFVGHSATLACSPDLAPGFDNNPRPIVFKHACHAIKLWVAAVSSPRTTASLLVVTHRCIDMELPLCRPLGSQRRPSRLHRRPRIDNFVVRTAVKFFAIYFEHRRRVFLKLLLLSALGQWSSYLYIGYRRHLRAVGPAASTSSSTATPRRLCRLFLDYT
uniref:Uncharacterized protein n=1 Tax=Leersia perrieri TaxID=77586 RepID=A0A0D9WWF5_9ORYZ